MNQSHLEANTCSCRQAQEMRVASFTSDWSGFDQSEVKLATRIFPRLATAACVCFEICLVQLCFFEKHEV